MIYLHEYILYKTAVSMKTTLKKQFWIQIINTTEEILVYILNRRKGTK